VTAQARITQADIDRVMKAAGRLDRARVIMRLATGEIEIIIGEPEPESPGEEWSDDDV
jgi:hypothetical protein